MCCLVSANNLKFMIKRSLVLLSYGNETENRRAVFCLLSFLSWTNKISNGISIVIYTDNISFFKKHFENIKINYVSLTIEMLKEMSGRSGFLHRSKVEVILQTFQKYPDNDVLFLDTDTFFYAKPTPLILQYKEGKSFMHKREYTIAQSLSIFDSYGQQQYPAAFIKYISSQTFLVNNKPEVFDTSDYSWNSGVLGLSKGFGAYMSDVLKLTDLFYENSEWFISEQLAFSFILQRHTSISSTDSLIYHYWPKYEKEFVDQFLFDLLEKNSIDQLHSHNFIRTKTMNLKRKIEVVALVKYARIAVSNRSWYHLAKKIVQILIKEPSEFRNIFYKE